MRTWWKRHPYLMTGAIIGGLLLPIFFLPQENGMIQWPWAALALPGIIATLFSPIAFFGTWVWRFNQKRSAKKALAARCQYEHTALMNGDTRTGVFGRFQPMA